MTFKFSHLIQACCALAITVITWVLAENASGDFHLSAQIIGVASTALVVVKLVAGLFGPSMSASVNTRAAAVSAVSKTLSMIAVLVLGAIVAGCASFWGAAAPVLDCGSKVAADAAQNMSVAQIVADLPAQCGMDAAAVMALIAASADAKVQHSAAYAETMRARAALSPAMGCK